jgi:ribosomal protein S18 acetylase RimI-like enzyme
LRHRGIGTELMIRAENHAIARGCHSVWLDTFQARGFYEAVEYELFGMKIIPLAKSPFLEKATYPVKEG